MLFKGKHTSSHPLAVPRSSRFISLLTTLSALIQSTTLVYAAPESVLATSTQSQRPVVELRAENSPKGQDELTAQARAHELLDFISARVIPMIPAELRTVFDQKKIILTLRAKPVAEGLFFPKLDAPNELTLEMRQDLLMSANAKQLIAHELFHAFHYTVHPNEEAWVREGLAQIFEFRVLGYFNGVNAAAALLKTGTPLMGEYDPARIVPEQYGHDLFYFYYLWSKCGGDPLFWSLVQGAGTANGRDSIDAVLGDFRNSDPTKKTPKLCQSFKESAIAFEVARVHNRAHYGDASSQDYHLWSTTLPTGAPREKVSQTEINQLPLFTPLFLDPSQIRLEKLRIEPLRIFWIQSGYPFQVRTEAPQKGPEKTDKSWRVLLIRTED